MFYNKREKRSCKTQHYKTQVRDYHLWLSDKKQDRREASYLKTHHKKLLRLSKETKQNHRVLREIDYEPILHMRGIPKIGYVAPTVTWYETNKGYGWTFDNEPIRFVDFKTTLSNKNQRCYWTKKYYIWWSHA